MKRAPLVLRSLCVVGLLMQASGSVAAKPVNVDLLGDNSVVKFEGKALAGVLDFNGSGKGVVGKFKITDGKTIQGSATFPMTNLDAEVRTKHMREYLDVPKFPDATFTPTVLPWTDPSEVLTKETAAGPFEGKLTLRGVEKPVKGTVSTKPEKDGKVSYSFAFDVLMSDFKIPAPVYRGVGVKDLVNVTVNTLAKVEVK